MDLRTVVFLSGAIGALMSVVFFFMHRDHRQSIQGLREWALAPLCIFLSTFILALQGIVTPWLSIVAANLVLIIGLSMYLIGTGKFYSESPARWTWWALVPVSIGLFHWTALQPDYVMRLIMVNVVLGAIQAHTFLLVWRRDRTSFAARFALSALGIMALLSLARVATTPWLPPGTTLFTQTALQSFFVATYAFSALSLTVGFVLLANERLRQQLHHLLSHDALTGTLSRRALFERAEQELERSKRSGKPVTLMVLDLDHFKRVNDEHGHLAGDRTLQQFAECLRQALRQIDVVGRFGGEEFVVLLPDTGTEVAAIVAERIRSARPSTPSAATVTVSIGVVSRPPLVADESARLALDTLVERADQALYQAKVSGRDRVVTLTCPS